jgi:HSP20 family molecular chaperone IbpA
VTLFRRREPLHVRLAREGGIPLEEPEARPAWDAAGIHGLHRVREWDAVVTLEAPEIAGERSDFVALPGGDLVVEEGPDDVRRLAEALEQELQPPYRAEAVRRGDGLWAVAGRRIEVVELPGIAGEELELTSHGEEQTLVVDGERAFGTVASLERPEHVVRARRIDGDRWEVDAAPL